MHALVVFLNLNLGVDSGRVRKDVMSLSPYGQS